jgi:hypothetical protein
MFNFETSVKVAYYLAWRVLEVGEVPHNYSSLCTKRVSKSNNYRTPKIKLNLNLSVLLIVTDSKSISESASTPLA